MASFLSIRLSVEEEARRGLSPPVLAGRAQRRAEDLAAESPARVAWACAPGCTFCCHLYVTVAPGEAEVIAAHLRETFSGPELEALESRVARRASAARRLGVGGYRRERVRCALLDDEGRCMAYERRPLKCRAHTSTSRGICEQVFRDEVPSGAVPLDRWYAGALEAVRRGMGGDEDEELHAALAEAL